MRNYTCSPVQGMVVVSIPMIAAIWAVAVPGVLTISSVLALGGLIVAAGWIGGRAYGNRQPTPSVAQLLQEPEATASRRRRRDQ